MTKFASVAFCLAVLCVSPSAALNAQDKKPDKVDVTGTWKVEVEVGGQTGEPEFTLKQDGEKITGKYKGSFGEQDVTGTVKGDKVEFGFDLDQGKVVYTGTVDKDAMKGEVKYGDLAGTWTAKREKGKEKDEDKPAGGGGPASRVEKATFTYATKAGQALKLDRFVDPSVTAPGKRPVIIFSIGGGWENGRGTGAAGPSLLGHFTSLGYAVIPIDYRAGVKEAKDKKEFTPANGTAMYLRAIEWGVEDLFDATSYVVKHADEWNVDKDRIVIMGGSAGATNSLVAEFNVANDTELARAHLPKGFRYAGVISMAGAFWLKADTPLAFKSKPAPILFFHGAKDQLVTYDEVQGPFSGYGPAYYCRKFPGPDYPKWFVDLPDGDHVVAASPLIENRHEIAAFLQRLVTERQEMSVHTVEQHKVPRTFGNAGKLFGDQSSQGKDAPAKK
ncbi:MAG: alpha/beta hydrolase [Gemmataceae bacterium]|nr:alpha/beta hydrolase [Gemmataceae bacterium]